MFDKQLGDFLAVKLNKILLNTKQWFQHFATISIWHDTLLECVSSKSLFWYFMEMLQNQCYERLVQWVMVCIIA